MSAGRWEMARSWPRRAAVLAAALGLGALSLPAACGGVSSHGPAPLDAQEDARSAFGQAQTALAAGQLDLAEILLERVLMLMPEHAEARIDFALLMARRGQADVARALISGLAQDPRTPPAHRQRLQALVAGLGAASAPPPHALQAPSAPPGRAGGAPPGAAGPTAQASAHAPAISAAPQWRAEAQWAYSSNPLARTGASDITLSLSDGPVTLPLASRPAPAAVSGLLLQGLIGEAGLDAAVQRLGGHAGQAAYRFNLWGPLPLPAAVASAGPVSWVLAAQKGFDGQRRHTAGLTAVAGQGRFTWAAYDDPDLPDRGLLFRADRLLQVGAGWSAQGSMELSRSTARHQGYVRWGLAAERMLSAAARVQAQVNWQGDLAGYSPLLESNARRQLFGVTVAVEQQLNRGGHVPLVMRAFSAWRHSNLALFDYRDTGVQMVFVRAW